MNSVQSYFNNLNEYRHRDLFDQIENIWDPLKALGDEVKRRFEKCRGQGSEKPPSTGLLLLSEENPAFARMGGGLMVERWMELEAPLVIDDLEIHIGRGTVLEPTAIIKGPAIIGEGSEIRQGAYIRGNVLIGDHCVIGHATEIKNSIVMNHTEAGHFNYVGDSIIGSYVNIGAGSRLANLQFRTPQQKLDEVFPPIDVEIDGKLVPTGLGKLGAVVGDHVEIGCNAVLCPGVLLGKESWIYPNVTVPKEYYPPKTFFRRE